MVLPPDSLSESTVLFYDAEDHAQVCRLLIGDGGYDIHSGIFEKLTDTTFNASLKSVEVLLNLAQSSGVRIGPHTHILDEGSGNGGPAHHIVRTTGARITCLNICEGQNAVNRERVTDLGLEKDIDVISGTFETLPEEWHESLDVIWSQEAYSHSDRKQQVLSEAMRVLKPGGHLIFTDIMASPLASEQDLSPIMKIMHINNLYTMDQYEIALNKVGFQVLRTRDLTSHLKENYRRLYGRLESERERLDKCSNKFLDTYKANLSQCIEILTSQEAQTWYAVVAKKPSMHLTNGASLMEYQRTPPRALKQYVAAKLHNIAVTHKNITYHGSAGICRELMRAVGIEPYEAVHIANCRNGKRWTTYAIPEDENHSFKLNGAAGRLGEVGDECIVFTFMTCERYIPAKVICFEGCTENKITDSFRYNQH